jgi:hypothetical protein
VKSVLLLVVNVALGASFALTESASAQVLSIGSGTIAPGGTDTVDLNISGLGNGTALGAYDINVGFNPSVVNFSSAAFGDPSLGDQLNLQGYGTINAINPGNGTVELFELSLDDPGTLIGSQTSSFTLATLTFDGVGVGGSPLALSVNAIGDENGNPLTTSLAGGSITVTSSTTTAAAPEIDAGSTMAGLTLLVGGLAVLRKRGRGSRPAVQA